jgi:multisubunit Na+/H+ antiporter MnhG subunit
MILTIIFLFGAILTICSALALMSLSIDYNRVASLYIISTIMLIIGIIIMSYAFINLDSYSVEDISIKNKFININHDPATGFIDNNTEYNYEDLYYCLVLY